MGQEIRSITVDRTTNRSRYARTHKALTLWYNPPESGQSQYLIEIERRMTTLSQ